MAALSSILNYAVELDFLKKNPAKKVKRLKEEPYQAKFISEEDFIHKFLPAANPQGLYGITELYALTFCLGLRSSEVRNLKWEHVDFKNRNISVYQTKTNTWKNLPMNDFLHEMLWNLKKDSKSEYIFINRKGEKLGSVRLGFKNTLKRADLPDMRFHDLRHSFVTNCAAKGISWDMTSLISGHKSYEMYQRYRHFFDRAALQVIKSFEAPKTFISSREKRLSRQRCTHK